MARKSKIIKSGGNIFADLDLPDAHEHYVKANLVLLISKKIEKQNLSQTQAAAKMGIQQPDVSKMLRGRFEGFSLERLLFFVRALGSDVEIKIKPARHDHAGRISVLA
jgi:predicted XRE-type DNA-binding protein